MLWEYFVSGPSRPSGPKKELWRRKCVFLDQGRLGPLTKRLPTSQWEGLLRKHLAKKVNFSAAQGLSAGLAACIMEKWPNNKSTESKNNQNPRQNSNLPQTPNSKFKFTAKHLTWDLSTNPPAIWWLEPQILAFASGNYLPFLLACVFCVLCCVFLFIQVSFIIFFF